MSGQAILEAVIGFVIIAGILGTVWVLGTFYKNPQRYKYHT